MGGVEWSASRMVWDVARDGMGVEGFCEGPGGWGMSGLVR
jgi:hypothetical protein